MAKFHREHSSLFRRKTQASIEIFLDDVPDELLDMVIVTFVYLEIKRAEFGRATLSNISEYSAYAAAV
jgi:hypothetical protein